MRALGALFYAETKRRLAGPFDVELRRLTETTAPQLGELFAAGQTPLAIRRANRCRACPLIEICRPKAAGKSAIAFRARAIAAALDEAADEDGGDEAKKALTVKKLLNTLFVTTEGANLRKGGENIVAKVEGAVRAPVRHHMLGSVMVFGAIFKPEHDSLRCYYLGANWKAPSGACGSEASGRLRRPDHCLSIRAADPACAKLKCDQIHRGVRASMSFLNSLRYLLIAAHRCGIG